jgi:hypothetical protein
MQELINKLISEVGLSSEQAGKAVSTVMDFVKTKLPPAFANNIEAMFEGKAPEDFAEATKEKLEDLADVAKEKLSEAADKAEDFAKDAFDKIKGMFGKDKE